MYPDRNVERTKKLISERVKNIRNNRRFQRFQVYLSLLVCINDLWILDAESYIHHTFQSQYIIIIGLCKASLLSIYVFHFNLLLTSSTPILQHCFLDALAHLCSCKMWIVILYGWNFNLLNWYFIIHLIFPHFALLLESIHVLNSCFYLTHNTPWWVFTTFFLVSKWVNTKVDINSFGCNAVSNNLYFHLWSCV